LPVTPERATSGLVRLDEALDSELNPAAPESHSSLRKLEAAAWPTTLRRYGR
jgi:hypothetical protein